ncbi:hypothetical protein Ade02nite_87950 [Paractinoplanes deccanensis]|uniref:DUF2062 domain-containing protein n=1 Tax=Paractinoplanes deccanensis TaxID=113561 RepID=A0ABQ3YJH4_9ACTN|nr:hypothetical protein [Actinoplanes deccanensis]GID80154.1 hypothetical protein Ade02nite_87950 [Actinoplanes deccanensis]
MTGRNLGQLALPGAAIGALAGLAALGLAVIAGQPLGWALATGLALGLPLTLLGGGFGLLMAAGKISPGVFAPTALYWLAGFPLARLVHEMLAGLLLTGRPALPPDVLGFLAYQAIVSLGFAIGFSWLYERVAPGWLRRIRHGNPRAERLYQFYLRHAEAQWKARESRRRARAAARAVRSKGVS